MKQPNIGDRKEVVRFAFFPMIIERRFIWFKRYKAVKEYKMSRNWDVLTDDSYSTYYWQTVERKLIRK